MLDQYIGVVLTFALAAIIVGIMVSASMIIGRLLGENRHSAMKDQVFECGNPPTGPARSRFSVRFYLVAILFIVFDVEVVFMYPWAVSFRSLGMFGFVEMTLFVLVLALGLVFVWRKGALEWD